MEVYILGSTCIIQSTGATFVTYVRYGKDRTQDGIGI